MSNDILESVSQRGYGAYDAENRRIKEISDELQRLCRLHEAQPRAGQEDRGRFEIEQRAAEQFAKSVGMWIPMDEVFDLGIPGPSGNENDTYMSALGFTKENDEGRYSNGTYLVWDVVPRNVLVDADGDMYVVDAEIKRQRQARCDEWE